MANRKIILPQYGTVMKRGVLYYRTRIKDANGKLVAIYAKTPEELYNKETLALEQIENATFHRKTPTVAEYCEKWLLMQSVHVRATTLTDYTSKVRRHIIAELGDKRMGEVSLDDIQLALVPVSKKSASVYKSVVILYKSIFRAAMESRIIDHNPTIYLTTKGGGVPQEERQALTDEQVERLLDAIRDLPPYVFVMIGLYAGLRREEILALQWDSVYLDTDGLYQAVKGTLSPKRMGVVIVAYFGAMCITGSENIIRYATWQLVCVGIALIIPSIIGAIASFYYFIRCKNDKIWSRLISVAAIWGIIRIVINNYQMIRYAEQYLSMNTTVRLVLQMAIYGLILYQTFTLTKKRKNAIEISNTEKQKNLID